MPQKCSTSETHAALCQRKKAIFHSFGRDRRTASESPGRPRARAASRRAYETPEQHQSRLGNLRADPPLDTLPRSPDNYWCWVFKRAVPVYVTTPTNRRHIECTYAAKELQKEFVKMRRQSQQRQQLNNETSADMVSI